MVQNLKSYFSEKNNTILLSTIIILSITIASPFLINSFTKDSNEIEDGSNRGTDDFSEKESTKVEIWREPQPMEISEETITNRKPFKTDVINMVPDEEILIAGYDPGNDRRKFYVHDTNGDELYNSGWNSAYKNTVCGAGDIDGDGNDELIIVLTNLAEDTLYIRTYDDAQHNYVQMSSLSYTSYAPYRNFQVGVGFINQDGYEDIVVTGYFNSRATMMYFQSSGNGLFSNRYSTWDRFNENPALVLGDFDGDSMQEVGMISNEEASSKKAEIHIWDFNFATNNLAIIHNRQVTFSGNYHSYWADAGDFDGDGKDEIVFIGTNSDGSDLNWMVIDDRFENFAELFKYDANDNGRTPTVVTGDFDNDGRDEIGILYSKSSKLYIRIYNDANRDFRSLWFNSYSNYPYQPYGVSLNTDRDQHEELMVCSFNTHDYRNHLFEIAYSGASNNYVVVRNENLEGTMVKYPYMAAGDFDGNGRKMSFQSASIIREQPEVLVLAAAAPNIDGKTHSIDLCGTTVGWEKTEESSSTTGFSSTDTVTLSTSVEIDLFFLEMGVEVSGSLSQSYEESETITLSTTFSQSMALASNEHGVYYSFTQLIQYKYRVISGSGTGTYVYINVPMEKIITCAELFTFVSLYPDYTYLLQYIPYDSLNPFSYYTKDQWFSSHPAVSINDAVISNLVQTQISQGFTEIGVQITRSTATTEQMDFGYEGSIKTTIGSFSYEQSHGRNDYTATGKMSAEGMTITAAIGGLTGDDYNRYCYNTQMIMYETRVNLEEGIYTFKVVDYYIEPVSGEMDDLEYEIASFLASIIMIGIAILIQTKQIGGL